MNPMINLSRRGALKSTAAIGVLAGFGCGKKNEAPSSAPDLTNLDAIATAQAIKNGDVTASEVVEAAIDRAEKANPLINAITTPYYDTARERAAQAGDGPWFGVPTFIKDLTHVIGQRTTYGSRGFANYIASTQSTLVSSIFASGMISLGKSATPEFGLTATTEPVQNGAARNPWNRNHSTGGSSGGAAALVSARVTPVAHASDGGGSIRIPASCCGVVGLKPTRGRMPTADRTEPRPLEVSEHGVESLTVRDTAAFLAMMEVETELGKVGLVEGPATARKKIAFHKNTSSGAAVDPEVAAVTDETARKLEALGHEVSEVRDPFDASVLQDFMIYWAAGAAQTISDWEKATGQKADYSTFEPFTYGLVEYYVARQSLVETAIGRLLSFERDYRAAFADVDLILSPVLAGPPPEIGYLSTTYAFPLVFERLSEYVAFTQYANISGAPAMSVPMGMSATNLPIGVQLAAAPGGERAILEVAYELEEAAPWIVKKPDLPF